MDLAATWLDLAGLGTNPAGMQGVTSRSLTGVLKGDLNRSRDYVSSGLKHWRMVVRRQCASCALLKYICCRGSNCQVGRAAISEKPSAWTEMLFDVSEGKDWREMKNLLRGDARAKWSVTAAEMRALLPPEFAAGCKNVQPYYVLTNRIGNGMNISPSSAPGVLDPEGVDDGCYIHTLLTGLTTNANRRNNCDPRKMDSPREDPRV
eukprot:scaffold5308_cov70-Phaeocystis_antarctica.AAC.4